MFRINGTTGCLFVVLIFILMFSIMRLAGSLIFTTPVGLVLLAYLAYRYFKKNKKDSVTYEDTYDQETHKHFESDEEVIDVDYEDYE